MLFNAFNVQSEKLTEKDLPILLQKFISRFSDLEALTIKLDEDLIGNKEKVKGTVESMDILKNKIKVFMKDIAKSMNYLQLVFFLFSPLSLTSFPCFLISINIDKLISFLSCM